MPQLIAFADYYQPQGDFMATELVRLRPGTLRPYGPRLRLGDAVVSAPNGGHPGLSPDGRTLALGGENFGELLLVDLARLRRTARIVVFPGSGRDVGIEVQVASWPRPHRLVVVGTLDGTWWAPHPSELVIVDPVRRRIVRRQRLGGSVFDVATTRGGTAAVLVDRYRDKVPMLVVVPPTGGVWHAGLRSLDLGGRDGVHLGGEYFPPVRPPALAVDGRRHAFVVVADRPIADIDLTDRVVRYHAVGLPHLHLAMPPAEAPGSGGVHLTYSVGARWFGAHTLAVEGSDEYPGLVPGYGVGHRYADRRLEVVDTSSWRLVRSVPATGCERAVGLFICSATTWGYPPDGKGRLGTSLVAYTPRWKIRYTKSIEWWGLAAGRLFDGSADGTKLWELDPRTGRTLRRVHGAPAVWPLDLLRWVPPR